MNAQCQIVEQENPATENVRTFHYVTPNLRPANLRQTMKIPSKNMYRAAHRHHMAIICFIRLLRHYILLFLLVLKMKYEESVHL